MFRLAGGEAGGRLGRQEVDDVDEDVGNVEKLLNL